MDIDRIYMRRALELAGRGLGYVSPNPMVGAVIVAPDGKIIGEGYHRRFGGPHAEVWAVRSVAENNRCLLKESTIYVTLEPCSHYGKTPPCAKLLIETGIPRVVVGATDPNPLVAGRGVGMLRAAGIEVTEGILADESRRLNHSFMTAHTLKRPYVTLKWAQSADGYMDHDRSDSCGAARFSSDLTSTLVHLRRSYYDAIGVGAGTEIADRPRLDVRLVSGRSPRRVLFDRHGLVSDPHNYIVCNDSDLTTSLQKLFKEYGITSLLVEGGPSLLRSFIDSGLWDDAYIETAAFMLGNRGTAPAPEIRGCIQDGPYFRKVLNMFKG